MRSKIRKMVSIFGCSIMLSGCLAYHSDRHFGDYYNTTKEIWGEPCITRNSWFLNLNVDTLGQSIALSGLLLAIYGIELTAPVGVVVHYAEMVTLAPDIDTLYLPLDFYRRDDYIAWRKMIDESNRRNKEEQECATTNGFVSAQR